MPNESSTSARSATHEIYEMVWLGLRFHQEQRFDRSLEQFWSSLLRSRELGYRDLESLALNNIGMVYQSWGKFDHALKFYNESLKLAESIRFVQGAVMSLNNTARLYEAWGRMDRAMEHYERSLSMSEENGELTSRRTTLLNMAMCLEKLGDFARCRKLLKEVVKIDQILQHPRAGFDKAYLERMKSRP